MGRLPTRKLRLCCHWHKAYPVSHWDVFTLYSSYMHCTQTHQRASGKQCAFYSNEVCVWLRKEWYGTSCSRTKGPIALHVGPTVIDAGFCLSKVPQQLSVGSVSYVLVHAMVYAGEYL